MSKVLASHGGALHRCPGCATDRLHTGLHFIPSSWHFNGDAERPTFSPSVKHTSPGLCCHYFIRDGKIEYCGDCTHPLAGQAAALPDIGDVWEDGNEARKEGENG